MTNQANTVQQIDPTTLLLDRNIRVTIATDKALVASIREHGVLEPIIAVQSSDGIRVRYGHRRTLAAIEAGQATVPLIVMGEDDDDELARLTTQWHENEQRSDLNAADKLAAIEQLSLLGLSPSHIVRRTKAAKQTVEDALAAKASSVAKAALARYDFLTVDQAAVVADFQDQPETVRALVAAAKLGDGDFAHVAQRARDDRAEAEERARLIESLTSTGTTVIDPADYGERILQPLSRLAGKKDQPMTPAVPTACPGHAAYVTGSWRGVEAVHVCTDAKAHDHRSLYGSGPAAKKPMDDEAKAERKTVIANNKAWASGETVRRAHLRTLLTRKTPPKGTVAYLAAELGEWSYALTRGMEHADFAAELLGKTTTNPRAAIRTALQAASEARAQVITLGLVLAAIEHGTDKNTWRNASDAERRYLAFLVSTGYVLCEVEQLAATAPTKRGRTGR